MMLKQQANNNVFHISLVYNAIAIYISYYAIRDGAKLVSNYAPVIWGYKVDEKAQ